MKKTSIIFILSAIISMGCSNSRTIDRHFMLYSDDIDDNIDLVYTNDNSEMFTVVDRKIIAFKKCSNIIFITQHPLKADKTVDEKIINYYIVDMDRDYSNESLKPYSISKYNFDDQFKNYCGKGELQRP